MSNNRATAPNQSKLMSAAHFFFFFFLFSSILIFTLVSKSVGRQPQRSRFRRHEIGRHHHDRQRLSLGFIARELARLLDPFAQVKQKLRKIIIN